MSTTTTVGVSAISAPKFNIATLEREVEALVASGTKDLEFELRKERIDPYRIDITKPYIEAEPKPLARLWRPFTAPPRQSLQAVSALGLIAALAISFFSRCSLSRGVRPSKV